MITKAMRALWRRLRTDGRGAVAVEFALIAPILIVLYFGLAEFCQAMLAERKATHVASSVGDLVAQSEAVTPAELDQILKVGPTLMAPFSGGTDQLKIRVTSVARDGTGKAAIMWTRANPTSAESYDITTLPGKGTNSGKEFLENGKSVIVAQAEYKYTFPVDFSALLKLIDPSSQKTGSTYTFKETFYLRPRKSESVACTGC